jgi:predicted  nucleic acid-binding Zn-ribbon protein|tara:strand:+ start:49 stop:318 length:270 start_codon:yes stop_codon:yes gene_type:complete
MDCWHCNEELIWGGDHDLEEGYGALSDEYCIVTNLSCPDCGSFVLAYYPRDEDSQEDTVSKLDNHVVPAERLEKLRLVKSYDESRQDKE